MSPQQSTSNGLPNKRTDARINMPLPGARFSYGTYAVFAVLVLLALNLYNGAWVQLILFSAALFALLAWRRQRDGGGEFTLWVWLPSASAPQWQQFAHNFAKDWRSAQALPEGFEGKAYLSRIDASPAGYHMTVEGNGAKLKAATEDFDHWCGADFLSVEDVNAQGVVWFMPPKDEPWPVRAARQLLREAGFKEAAKGQILTLAGSPDEPRWVFTVTSTALTREGVEPRRPELLAATALAAVPFGHLDLDQPVSGKIQFDFRRGTPQSPLDFPLPSPHGGQ